jgi:hypothetical protein
MLKPIAHHSNHSKRRKKKKKFQKDKEEELWESKINNHIHHTESRWPFLIAIEAALQGTCTQKDAALFC